jgi:hypothetical protein
MEMLGEDGSKRTDVTIMCGRRCVLCNLAIASPKVAIESIVVSDSSLALVSLNAQEEDRGPLLLSYSASN